MTKLIVQRADGTVDDALNHYDPHELPKSEWGPGEWQDEPDRAEWRDKATGLPCLAVRSLMGGNWCGYVGVYPGHPWHGQEYDGPDREVEVHGGLTYSGACKGHICHTPDPGEPEVWWFGFDCAHAFDRQPKMEAVLRKLNLNFPSRRRLPPGALAVPLPMADPEFFPEETYKPLAFVEEECRQLAAQLKSRVPA